MSAEHKPQSERRLQYLLRRTTSETMEYDPDRAIDAFHAIAQLIPKDDNRGYGDHDWLDTEGRIIALFELTEGSILGDMIFGSLADHDAGSDLIERWDDE